MKKLISVVLLLAMVLGLFAGCGKDKEAITDLHNAVEYLTSMYKVAGKDEAIVITADQDVLSSVVVDGISYTVEWTVEITEGDAESVTVSESTKENHVKLDIPLHSGSDILFTATATVSDAEGNTEAATFNYKVAGVQLAMPGATMEELVEAAYALDEDQAMEGLAVLTGVVTMINTPYDAGYKNLTCTIVVGDLTDMPIKCYRLKGEGAETLAVGDTITVSGTLKNYGGTIEFDAGCMIDELIKSDAPAVETPADPMQIIQDAYALEDNASLPYSATLTGTITSIDTPYDAGYQNITVTIAVTGAEDKPIKCYRLKGEGADRLAVDNVITVTGILMKYNGVVEFAQGCTLDAIVSGDPGVAAPADMALIVDEAYALAPDATLPYMATLTGIITSVDTPYDATYQNITVTITVASREQKPIKCYRIKGTGADTLAVGDTITVTGTIKNYGGTIEFDAGSALVSVVKATNTVTKPDQEVAIVDQAYRLQRDQALPYVATLTGKVSNVKDAYNSQYKNITVIIKVPGRENLPIMCYRLKGTDVDKVAVNDTITVTGTIKNYNGTIQFDAGCVMDKRVSGGGTVITQETDPLKIIDMAYALGEGQEMSYDVALTGKVTAFDEAYNAQYKSVSVIIQVRGRESKPILLFGLKGDGVENVAVGDTVTAMGRLKNFYGTVEMTNCTMTNRVSGGGKPPVQETDPNKILAAGQKLNDNEELPYDVTLSGKVVSIDEAYDKEYKNVTATISVSGTNQTLKLYRLKGDGVEKLAVNDTITVEGKIKKYYGELELVSCTMTKRTSGGGQAPVAQTDYKKIVDEAYALEQGASLAYTATLEGRITELKSPYDGQYKNMTVVIVVSGREDKPIECYRMKGDNIGNHLCVGDTITVEGKIKNYNGTVEFDSGCKMTARKPGSASKPSDSKQIVDAAFALAENASLPYFATLTGMVKSIDEPYTDQYKNVTLTMTVQGTNGAKDIIAYRLKGDQAATVAVGNTITVTGAIKRFVRDKEGVHEDKIEFDSGCVLESLQKSGTLYVPTQSVTSEIDTNLAGAQARAAETNANKIYADAYALAEDESLPYEATLTGKITAIKDPYNSQFKNISVYIEVAGHEDKPMLCYRIKGEGADKLLVDDVITVTGTITNYKGTVEFKAGSTLDKVIPGGGSAPVAPSDPKQIVEEAFALAQGTALPYTATLTGVITEIGKYNEQYGDLTLKMVVEGKEFECYALKGENVLDLAVGDTITVTGTIKNYYGKIEFDKPTLDNVVKGNEGGNTDPQPTATKLYCQPAAAWTECYVYTWDDGGNAQTGGWPGTLMTKEANGLWSYEIPETATNVIFSNGQSGGGSNQTDNLTVPADSKVLYVVDTKTWTELPVEGGEGDGEGGNEGGNTNTAASIINAAYALKDGETLEGPYTLTGVISSVDNPYDSFYGNITVTIKVPGCEDKPMKCYRIKGEGAEGLAVGDTITVTGKLTNYKGSIQFAQGSSLDNVIKGENEAPVAPEDPKQIVDEAFALEAGASLPYVAQLTGKIVSVDTPYDETYKNITVTIEVEGTNGKKNIECYRLKGTGVDALKVDDIITVEGIIKRYIKTDEETGEVVTDKVEFSTPTLISVGENNQGDNNQGDNNQGGNNQGGSTTEKTPAQIVAEAYALENGQSLSYEATLTGKITSVDYAYSATSGDITVTITVEGKALKCYRMTGTGIETIKVGDTITVKGKIKNYNGTIEFDKPTMVSVNTGNSGNNGSTGNNSGDKAPGTNDYSMTGLVVIMVMACGALVVLSKKKFYC